MNVFCQHDSNGAGNALLFPDGNLFFQFLRNRFFKTVRLIDLLIDLLCRFLQPFFIRSEKYNNVFISTIAADKSLFFTQTGKISAISFKTRSPTS